MNLEMPGTTTQTQNQNREGISSNPELIENESSGRIRMEEFYNHPKFTNEEIDIDIAECERIRKGFDIKNRAKGDYQRVLEILKKGKKAELVLKKGIMYGWINANVEVVDTSEHDDYVNHIDEILDITLDEIGTEHLGLSVDFATSDADVELKLKDVFEVLDKGDMAKIKYFKTSSRGLDKDVKLPRIIIGASRETVNRLASLEEDIDFHTRNENDSLDSIKKDVFKYVLFGEILAQLSVFCHRLEKVVQVLSRQNSPDSQVVMRATESLDTHKRALDAVKIVMEKSGVTLEKIRQHIKGDVTATHVASALSKLSQTQIGSFNGHRRVSH